MEDLTTLTVEELERKLRGLHLKFNSEIDKADRMKRAMEERCRDAAEAWALMLEVRGEIARRKGLLVTKMS